MNHLKKVFQVREENLKRLFDIKISHNPSDGRFREDLIKTILDIIPQKYSVGNGFVVDSEGNLSNEMDLIIFDDVYVPRFFMESYSVIPIESVVAIIQVKTTLDSAKLNLAIENLNSIDNLVPKKGGKIISASDCKEITEQRHILPLKILVSGSTKTELSEDKCFEIDIVYSLGKEDKDVLLVKEFDIMNVVSKDIEVEEMQRKRRSNKQYKINHNDKLYRFSFAVLDYLTLINNSMIVNYDAYFKGGEKDE